jgi:hypothetical protein
MVDHIPDAEKMLELSRSLTRAGVDSLVFRAIDGYWYDDDDGRSEVTPERAERELCYAAILWLMGRGWSVNPKPTGFFLERGFGSSSWKTLHGDTIIDCLLDAAELETQTDGQDARPTL